MKYTLNKSNAAGQDPGFGALKRLIPLLKNEKRDLVIASIAIVFTSASALVAPLIIGYAVDHFIVKHDYTGVFTVSIALFGVYVVNIIAAYIQTMRMGSVGRRVLYTLRNEIFFKLQGLPVSFFNQNKVGDLISRINSDTDRLGQLFTQVLMQFIGNFFLVFGAGIFLVTLNVRLGAAALLPALGVFVFTKLVSSWVKRKNAQSLQSLGGMSAEIQESITNFKVIVAFNRLDYFRKKFNEANEENYKASVRAGVANNVFVPVYAFASTIGQLIVLAYGVVLIQQGHVTVGLLISFLLYVNNFYTPLRQLASVWATFQLSLAALDRISEVLALESDLVVMPLSETGSASTMKQSNNQAFFVFNHVSFRYEGSEEDVLKQISFALERGKTYALVGPTGGGKTTTASLMARLYDPTEGMIELDGQDIRSYTPEERAKKIGFILQEPFLFSGTLLDNLFYGHPDFASSSKKERLAVLEASGLGNLLTNFEKGFDTKIQTSGDTISLGQRQLIAFVRAVLRKPEILILDEATANIDTVTEQLLEKVIAALPSLTTKVVIAHRLNTIENADEIFFVNNGEIKPAGSFDHAVEMLLHGKRET